VEQTGSQPQLGKTWFIGTAQIGRGPFPLWARTGDVKINDGLLTLTKTHEITKHDEEIVLSDVPVREIRARPQHLSAKGSVRVWIRGSSYLFKWDPSKSVIPPGTAIYAANITEANLLRGVFVFQKLRTERALTKWFLSVVEEFGGQVRY
jgi:hypothetical protein